MVKNNCGHRLACTYGRADYKRDVCQVWWCHQCGALAIRKVQGGRPKRGDWWYVIGNLKARTGAGRVVQ